MASTLPHQNLAVTPTEFSQRNNHGRSRPSAHQATHSFSSLMGNVKNPACFVTHLVSRSSWSPGQSTFMTATTNQSRLSPSTTPAAMASNATRWRPITPSAEQASSRRPSHASRPDQGHGGRGGNQEQQNQQIRPWHSSDMFSTAPARFVRCANPRTIIRHPTFHQQWTRVAACILGRGRRPP